MEKNLQNGFYKACDLIMKMAYINILWMMFSILGVVVLGFFPATVAMFSVIRDLLSKKDIPIFQNFWTIYKNEFIKSNVLGLILLVIGYIFYIDLLFLREATGHIQLLYMPLMIVCIIFFLTLLYIFPVYVHYDINILPIIKNSFFLMVLFPIYTISMLIICLIVYFIMITFPSLLIFFSGSVFSLILMSFANFTFSKNEQRLELEKGN
ncbi:YesL family protein [Halalkalibacter sp. APA_J-10(15)]|uniref:YesL family protein n=1 Tax=Halalkalibacter sp. APA_J-10(15) TaxID=2933805 RepID=UPI001FF4B74E|nr:YesL family protein [Halalkalibacter sp. APA_J-10(15)]MCK0473675.1 YesL family protein [Halalkalibacter sp. APA_J-10(15)]